MFVVIIQGGEYMKKLYELPLIEIVKFDVEDVICTSKIVSDEWSPGKEGSSDFGDWLTPTQ